MREIYLKILTIVKRIALLKGVTLTTLIIDGNNVAYKNLFNSPNPEDDVDFFLWRHKFLSNIIDTLELFKPDEVILTIDSKNSWRYDIYPNYKEKRKIFKENSKVDFDRFYPIFTYFIDQLKSFFTSMKVIKLSRVEGDDVVAVVARYISQENDVIIYSADKDFFQLHSSKIKQYSPIKREYLQCINPNQEKLIKIITGDKSDSIPSIKKRLGVKTAAKILTEGLDEFLQLPENEEVRKNFKRNERLIDFDYIPNDIQESIINTYINYEVKRIDSMKLVNFFSNNQLEYLKKSWTTYAPAFRKLESVRKMQKECISIDGGGEA